MAQHTPKVDPMAKLIGFASALVMLVAVFYLVTALFNTAENNALEGQVVEKPASKEQDKEEEAKVASADDSADKAAAEETSSKGSGGDIAAGKEKFASCAACHGADGKGQGGAFPVMTGIPADEAEKKLTAYREGDQEYLKSVGLGDRYGTMAPNAANLSDEDIADLAAYIGDEFGGGAGGGSAEAEAGDGSSGGAVDGDIAAGKQAYAACAACHGADGKGQGGAFPVLTEMDAAKVQKKLTAYREGDQEYLKSVGLGGRYGTMAPNAANLSDEQIANLSVYIADAFGGTNSGGGDSGADEAESGDEQAKAEDAKEEKDAEPRIVSESVVNHGRALYSSCAICHGDEGEGGELFAAPKLVGTKMDQTISLLKIYRKGQEMGPNSNVMIAQATHLGDDEIEALGAYIQVMDEEDFPADE